MNYKYIKIFDLVSYLSSVMINDGVCSIARICLLNLKTALKLFKPISNVLDML